jgi:hypothetical protein
MTPDPSAPLPLSHPVRVDDIKLRGSHIVVRAQAAELPAIAAHLGLASVEALEARYVASRSGDKVKLEGTILAKLHQTCIVSLDAFPVELKVPVRLDFAPEEESRIAARRAETEGEGKIDIEVQLNEDDPPEPIVDGVIDLGTVTLEFLALGSIPIRASPASASRPALPSPRSNRHFAALAKLKRGE